MSQSTESHTQEELSDREETRNEFVDDGAEEDNESEVDDGASLSSDGEESQIKSAQNGESNHAKVTDMEALLGSDGEESDVEMDNDPTTQTTITNENNKDLTTGTKRPISPEPETEEPIMKKFKFSKSKLMKPEPVVGTNQESHLYGNLVNQYEKEEDQSMITVEHFKAYHLAKQIHNHLKELETKQDIIKLLPPKEFRFKMFLEDYLNKIISRHFRQFTNEKMLELKKSYKNYYLHQLNYEKTIKNLKIYKNSIKLLQSEKFELTPFTPGCTPFHYGRKYLTINKFGAVWIETKTSNPMISFNTYDISIKKNYWFNVDEIFDLGYLSETGLLIAKSGYFDEDNEKLNLNEKFQRFVPIKFKNHQNGNEINKKIQLLKGEYINNICFSSKIIYIFLNTGIIKKFSINTGFFMGIEKQFPTICSLGNDKYLFALQIKNLFTKETIYSIKSIESEEYLVLNKPLNLSIKKNSMISSNNISENINSWDLIRGIFFNDNKLPCFVDNEEFLYIFQKDFELLPSLNLLESFNEYNKSHNNLIYFPISISENNVQVIIIKDLILENKLKMIYEKIEKAKKNSIKFKEEIKAIDKKINLIPKIHKEPDEMEFEQNKLTKERNSLINRLSKNQKIFLNLNTKKSNISNFILKNYKDDNDVFSSFNYNFPWFPLPPINNFRIELPTITTQENERYNKFNEPQLLKAAEEELKTIGDDIFNDVDNNMEELFGKTDEFLNENDKLNKLISSKDLDSVNINSMFLMDSITNLEDEKSELLKIVLSHDSNKIKLFHQFLLSNKLKLAFNLIKSLKLNQSFQTIKKICELTNNNHKLKKAIGYWQEKKLNNYKNWLENCR